MYALEFVDHQIMIAQDSEDIGLLQHYKIRILECEWNPACLAFGKNKNFQKYEYLGVTVTNDGTSEDGINDRNIQESHIDVSFSLR